MAGSTGPNIVNNGLILSLDAANSKSFIGEPTTNLISNADTMSSWTNYYRTISSSTFVTEFGTTGYRFVFQPSWNGIYRNFNLVNSGTYTFSAWFRYFGGSANNNGAQVYISNYGGGDTALGLDKTKVGVWQRVSHTISVTSPTNVYFYLISYGGVDNGTTNPDYSTWEVTMPQIEAKSYATTFVNGTRGTTVATGGGWVDRTSNAYHGELVNGPTYNSNNGGSLTFDGTNDYISTSFDLSWNNTNSVTIFLFLKPTSLSTHNPFIGKGPSNWEWQLIQNTTSLGFVYWNTGGGHTNGPTVTIPNFFTSTTEFVNICMVWNHVDNKYYFYRNASLVDTITWIDASINQNRTDGINIGGNLYTWGTNGPFWTGAISNIQIYNRALSSTEIQQNYNSQKTRFGL